MCDVCSQFVPTYHSLAQHRNVWHGWRHPSRSFCGGNTCIVCLTCLEDRAACIKHLRDAATRCLEIWCEMVQPRPPDDEVLQALEREETDANRLVGHISFIPHRLSFQLLPGVEVRPGLEKPTQVCIYSIRPFPICLHPPLIYRCVREEGNVIGWHTEAWLAPAHLGHNANHGVASRLEGARLHPPQDKI